LSDATREAKDLAIDRDILDRFSPEHLHAVHRSRDGKKLNRDQATLLAEVWAYYIDKRAKEN
jgi:hypothetical protein